MRYYVALAHRWNQTNNHTYIVGVSKDDPATLTPSTHEQLTTPEEIACLDEALAAFWAVVKSRLPGTAFDLRPRFAFQLEEEAARAILTWKTSNQPILE